MKIIIMNKRKLEVFITLIILMGILFAAGEMVKGHLKAVSFMQNNIKSLKTYEVLDGKFSYKLPSEWTTSIKDFPGNQIIYHNEFISKDLSISGFVQVWNEEDDLKNFLDISKEASKKQNKIKNYKISDFKMGDKKGYLVKYIMKSKDVDFVAYEYFIKYNKGFIRFSFFMKNKDFKEDIATLYDSILKTVSLK
ncbi:MAG: hypothetical protein VB130_09000 [Clostridium sp.]|nr:hypothetical protein [Clostridium sp.]